MSSENTYVRLTKRSELPGSVWNEHREAFTGSASEGSLGYNLKELSEALGISKVSIYRLESRGLLKSLPYLRTKIYTRKEVERFLEGRAG